MATETAGKKVPTPDDVINSIMATPKDALKMERNQHGVVATLPAESLAKKWGFEKSVPSVTIEGFETKLATDIYVRTGELEKAERAELLIQLFGEDLYQIIKTSANCAGIDNEADYLAQELWLAFERDEFNPTGAEEPFDKEVDGQVTSPGNQLITKVLKASTLGRVVQIAKSFQRTEDKVGISNRDCLRWGTLNYFGKKLARGY